jgi:hypothetical protein
MFRSRFFAATALVAALTIIAQTSRSEEKYATGAVAPAELGIRPYGGGDAQERAYTIYSLAELGEDADLGKWIAETIPEVIEPGTWKGQGVLRYYAPKNILVVYHTPAVQAKVDGFLKNVKKSLPSAKAGKATAAKTSAQQQMVVPAGYRAPALLKASTPAPEQQLGYAVPAPAKAPKHLFHFIIRYEGEGIIDDNVVKFMKAQSQAAKQGKDESASPVTIGGACAPTMTILTPASSSVAVPSGAGAPSTSATPSYSQGGNSLGGSSSAPSTSATPSGTTTQEDKKADKKDKEDKTR